MWLASLIVDPTRLYCVPDFAEFHGHTYMQQIHTFSMWETIRKLEQVCTCN